MAKKKVTFDLDCMSAIDPLRTPTVHMAMKKVTFDLEDAPAPVLGHSMPAMHAPCQTTMKRYSFRRTDNGQWPSQPGPSLDAWFEAITLARDPDHAEILHYAELTDPFDWVANDTFAKAANEQLAKTFCPLLAQSSCIEFHSPSIASSKSDPIPPYQEKCFESHTSHLEGSMDSAVSQKVYSPDY